MTTGTIANPHTTLTLQLLKTTTLPEIEEMTCRLANAKHGSVDIWLAKDLGSQFFKDSRIVTLLAAAAHRKMSARVIDWIVKPDERHTVERFGSTLEGLAALEFANAIVDASKSDFHPSLREHRWAVVEKNGISSPEKTVGKALTFCAFDPELPTPIGFAGIRSKDDFLDRFRAYRRNCFEIGVGEGFTDSVPRDIERAIGSFAYELWQNSFQHGRLDQNNLEIRGMRYLRIRKHIGHDKAQFIRRAAGFQELQAYLQCQVPVDGTYKFYEISIGDCGLGIVDRLLSTRPELADRTHSSSDRAAFINRVMSDALTSKRTQSGAGHGLQHAIQAVHVLQGFVSLRTGSNWLYYDARSDVDDKNTPCLSETQHSGKLCSVGTQFSLIFPLVSSPRK
ncbi:hypothetical protein Acid345_4256 [Candidatus Koribacter versatilis Ellin345]|uniref:Uncharacterized protein n=1 Tax=Koribacter versatilis (strain Ellin345) TaxID=204669 RepID=Q1IIP4_KORVE|nr:hypothetical protein [Candidatus Koribacter versatilis]ABF43256.1 hypothetical protein Acid345_4256 [Candidatus Koribacter versatilis Ellin345]